MLTIPKLIEPLQIALAMRVPPGACGGARARYRPELRVTVMMTGPGVFHTGSSLSTGLST